MSKTRKVRVKEAVSTNGHSAVVQSKAVERGAPASSGRLVSLDALRGFNMFWIIGGAELFAAIAKAANWGWLNTVSDNLTEHVEWEGFHFHDMIFPLFLFIMGVTFPFSSARAAGGRASRLALARKVIFRSVALMLLGLVYYGLFDLKGLDHQRIMGVLQRLGIAWGIAALIAIFTGLRGQVAALVSILVGYWLAMRFMPVPGHQPGDMSPFGNFANYMDRQVFRPGQLYERYGDPEGLFSTIPAVATALLGILAGQWLRTQYRPMEKARGLAAAGLILLALGHLWGLEFPVIKKIWTSSYVLVAGGWSLLLLATFYTVIDAWGIRRGTFFWVIIGLNPITIYVGQRIIDFRHISEFFLKGAANQLQTVYGAIVLAAGLLAVKWLFLLFLHRRRIYLKV